MKTQKVRFVNAFIYWALGSEQVHQSSRAALGRRYTEESSQGRDSFDAILLQNWLINIIHYTLMITFRVVDLVDLYFG